MKKIIAIASAAILMALSINASAQIGFVAGYQNSMLRSSAESISFDGFYAGVDYAEHFNAIVGFTPGVHVSYLTHTDNVTTVIGHNTGTWKDIYVDVPLMVTAGWNVSDDLRWFAYAGPTVSVGISSVYEGKGNLHILDYLGYAESQQRYDFYQNNNMRRFDVLLGGGVGFEFSRIRFSVGYDYGLLNRYIQSDNSAHRGSFKAGVSFLLF